MVVTVADLPAVQVPMVRHFGRVGGSRVGVMMILMWQPMSSLRNEPINISYLPLLFYAYECVICKSYLRYILE